MKNSSSQKAWMRLVEAARRAPDASDDKAPYGFSTRVAALAMSQPQQPGLASALDLFSWRALAAALTLMIACVASSYTLNAGSGEDEIAVQDPVSEYIELSS